MPSLWLYCNSKACDRDGYFDPGSAEVRFLNNDGNAQLRHVFVTYTCRHCQRALKIFALRFAVSAGGTKTLRVMKFGEDPPGVGPTPRSLKALLGEQWDLFLQGRRSEIAGLGIGAFTYYRRVVENVWQTVLAHLIEVAGVDGSPERLKILTAAQKENHFTRSMEAAKGEVPTSLYVDGHNPFQTLYDACGNGLHEYSDEECIARARMIRLILARFADRAKAVLSEDKEFRQALGGLAAKSTP